MTYTWSDTALVIKCQECTVTEMKWNPKTCDSKSVSDHNGVSVRLVAGDSELAWLVSETGLWCLKLVSDTFTICLQDKIEELTDHINSINSDIKFTRELETDGQIASLDSLISRNQDGSLDLSVYQKPTHTNQYLNFSSNHPLHQKLGVVCTLRHRWNTIVTKEQDRVTELDTLQKALSTCRYPKWIFTRTAEQITEKRRPHRDKPERSKGMVVLPYASCVASSKSIRWTRHSNRRTAYEGLIALKDKTPPQQAAVSYTR